MTRSDFDNTLYDIIKEAPNSNFIIDDITNSNIDYPSAKTVITNLRIIRITSDFIEVWYDYVNGKEPEEEFDFVNWEIKAIEYNPIFYAGQKIVWLETEMWGKFMETNSSNAINYYLPLASEPTNTAEYQYEKYLGKIPNFNALNTTCFVSYNVGDGNDYLSVTDANLLYIIPEQEIQYRDYSSSTSVSRSSIYLTEEG